ncbi:MAG: glycosyltransferase, partial [Myxococcota bacterium]|nr:glycosyltransferase [Myxococcota bacterium]
MRVCIVTRGDLWPTNHGAAVKIVRTAEALSRLGDPCFLVTDDRDRYWRFDEGRVTAVPYTPRVRAAQEWKPLPRLGRWAEGLCGWLGYPAEETFLYRPMFDPSWWARTLAVGRLEDVDVFQAEFPGYGVPAWLASRLLGRRCSIVQHNVEWDRLAEFGHDVGRIRQTERAVLHRVDDVIAVSADDRRRMVAAGVDSSKVTVIPHGVDLASFAEASSAGVRERWGISPETPLLFFHGTLHYGPNTEAVRFIAQDLLPLLLEKLPNLKILVCGQNPPTYYAHPALIFTGPVDDLPEHVAAADVCLCPVQTGGGTRMKLLEYMAAGKPTVSTTKGAEGIPSGEALVLADSVERFAEATLGLLSDGEARSAQARAGRSFARSYDWGQVGRAYIEVYSGKGRGQNWYERLGSAAGTGSTMAPVDAHLPSREVSKPLTLLLLINRGCNLRCTFCDLWDRPEQMNVQEQLIPLLDDARSIGTETLVITGGEPLLHPDLFVGVRAARERGLAVNITSNGTLVSRRWDELCASGVNSVSLSLDGLESTHDRLRGRKGSWRTTMGALDRLAEEPDIGVSVYFVVTRDNIDELPRVFDLARERGAGFDFWPVNDAPDLHMGEEHRTAWMAAVDHVAEHLPQVAARRAYYEEGLAYHGGRSSRVRCLGLVDQYGVKYNGDLLPCCVWEGEGLVVGNVFETGLRKLWYSGPVREA